MFMIFVNPYNPNIVVYNVLKSPKRTREAHTGSDSIVWLKLEK